MFNLQSFSSQKGSVADGAASNALNRIRSLLTKLLHSPETGVLFLKNDDEVISITKGQIVTIVDADAVNLAVSDVDAELSRSIAICLNDSIGPTDWGYFRFAGEAEVLLNGGLTPVEADYIKLDITPGQGTVSSAAILGPDVRVGLITDASEYVSVSNRFVKVVLENCCMTIPA